MKKILTMVLLATFVFNIILGESSINAQAAQKERTINEVKQLLLAEKENIKFQKGGYIEGKKCQYTYQANGLKFMVKENRNSSFTDVHSEIYLMKGGKYKELVEQKINVDGSEINTTLIYQGKEYVEKEDIRSERKVIENNTIYNAGGKNIIMPMATYDGMKVTDKWTKYGTFKYSYKIKTYTISAVTTALTAIVSSSSLGLGGAVAVATVGDIAKNIVSDKISKLYYTDIVYYKTVIPPEKWMFRTKVAEKSVFKMYKDSSRTKQVGETKKSYFYIKGYKK